MKNDELKIVAEYITLKTLYQIKSSGMSKGSHING